MIRKLREGFASKSYQTKLLLLLLPVIFVTMLLLTVISIRQANQLIVTQHQSLYSDQCAKIVGEMEQYIEQALTTTEMILYDDTVYSYIFEDTADLSAYAKVKRQSNLTTYFNVLCQQNGYRKMRLYVRDEYGAGEDSNSMLRLLDQFRDVVKLDHELNSRNDQTAVSGVYYAKDSGIDPKYSAQLVSAVRYVIDGTLNNVVGIISIDLTAGTLLNQWDESFEEGLYTLKLIDQYGETIDTCGGGETVENEGMRLELPVGDYGWTLVASVSDEVLCSGNRETIRYMLLASLAVSMALMFMVAFITRHMMRRLVNLKDSIYESAALTDIRAVGSLHFEEGAKDGDEVDKLRFAYGSMLRRIETLTLEFERSIARETESRILVLQSQINPHFLYNTLAAIKSYIEINDPAQASDLLMHLSDYFRQTLSKGAYVISLREELEIAAKYLDIQKVACGMALEYSVDVPTRVGEILTPKLLLQPFVENAVLYGSNGGVFIRIWGSVHSNVASICIDDNGTGIPEEVRAVLMGEREPAPDAHIGYGIRNVRNRLKLFYGDKAQLLFFNLPEGGTRVEIQIRGFERSDGG